MPTITVNVNGQPYNFPDTMSQDEIKSVLRKKFPPKGDGSFASNMQARTTARQQEGEEIANRVVSGETNPYVAALQFAGKLGASDITDPVAEVVSQGMSAVGKMLPESVKQLGADVASSGFGQAVKSGVENVSQKYAELKQKHPDVIGSLESLGLIATLPPITKPIITQPLKMADALTDAKITKQVLKSGTPIENIIKGVEPVQQQFSKEGRDVAQNYALAKKMGKGTELDTGEFLNPMLENINKSLKEKGAYIGEKGEPFEGAALPTRIVRDFDDMAKDYTVDVNKLGRMRQNITRSLHKETNPNAQTALKVIKDEFDNAWNNLGEKAIMNGNPEAINQWRKSVEEYAKYAKKYGTDKDIGQSPVFENVIKKNALTNEQVANAVIGTSFGKDASGQVIKRLIDNGASKENLRNGVILRTMKIGRDELEGGYSIPKVKAAFKDLIEEHPDLANSVFSKEELKSLNKFANSSGGLKEQLNWLIGKTPVVNKISELTGIEKAMSGKSVGAKRILNKAFKDAEVRLADKPVFYGKKKPLQIEIKSNPEGKVPPQIQQLMEEQ